MKDLFTPYHTLLEVVMRIPVFVMLFCVGAATAAGQIPNSGFEQWTTDPDSNRNPVGWQTTNSFPLVNVEPVAPGFTGSFAMRVRTVNAGFTFPGMALLQVPLSVSQIPRRLSVAVKATIMPGDQALIMMALFRGDTVVAAQDSCTFKIKSSITQFTTMEFPLAIQTERLPDSLILIVASGLVTGTVGTELTVDDIKFTSGGATDVAEKEIPAGKYALEQNFPNPFNPISDIGFSISELAWVRVSVFDLMGREVAVLVSERRAPGRYTVRFDATGMSSGVYFCRMTAGNYTAMRKMVLMR